MLNLDDNLNQIAASGSIAELRRIMSRSVSELGYSEFSYLDIRRYPLGKIFVPFFVSTAKSNFIDTYVSESFFAHDPVIRRAAISNAPFTWADCPEYHEWRRRPRSRSRAHTVMRTADAFGYTQGYVIPIHAVDSQGLPASALCTLFWRERPQAFEPVASAPPWLRLVVATMHERMLALRGASANDEEPSLLTDRECECLVWTCRGKTRSETGDILSISDKTVEFHLQNARRKLGVRNKLHSVAKAIRMGLIAP